MAQVHGLRGRPSPGVQEKRLVLLIRIKNTFKVTAKRKEKSNKKGEKWKIFFRKHSFRVQTDCPEYLRGDCVLNCVLIRSPSVPNTETKWCPDLTVDLYTTNFCPGFIFIP